MRKMKFSNGGYTGTISKGSTMGAIHDTGRLISKETTDRLGINAIIEKEKTILRKGECIMKDGEVLERVE